VVVVVVVGTLVVGLGMVCIGGARGAVQLRLRLPLRLRLRLPLPLLALAVCSSW